MIRPEEFPYIKSLYVNDCYTYKDFNIELYDYKPFSYLILTGKNGSGKSTILRALDNTITKYRFDSNDLVAVYQQAKTFGAKVEGDKSEVKMVTLRTVTPSRNKATLIPEYVWNQDIKAVYSYFKAKRVGDVLPVESPSKEIEFTNKFNASDSTEFFISKFRQYLVNRKVEQAFSQIESQTQQVQNVQFFFDSLEDTLNQVFEGTLKEIEFDRSAYEFYLNLTDGRQLTFNTLSEGFSAFISIFMDLFIRVDIIRKQVGDYNYNPCGIVLIDEPETHLHLQLQEQVLPLLTSLFPYIQFITATHSPAVIASINNATIFDLTTKESRGSEETVGRSYSELMRGHFGLKNEYSGIADELFRKVDQILKENKGQPDKLKNHLQQFFVENEAYFSPTFRVELESMILENA